jgi:hypothetical protein
MTRTRAADAVMPAWAHPASRWSDHASARPTARSCRLRPVSAELPQRLAVAPCPPCPRQPLHVHPLYLYVLPRHAATHSGWSFDPGRDMLCILTLPPQWGQWP